VAFVNVRGRSDKNYYNLTTEMEVEDALFQQSVKANTSIHVSFDLFIKLPPFLRVYLISQKKYYIMFQLKESHVPKQLLQYVPSKTIIFQKQYTTLVVLKYVFY